MLILEAPSGGVTGERIVLDASGTFDFDGDEITFSWSQLHNPDRYTGTEYVTGIDVELENDGDAIRSFTPEWPGNYRFEVVAADIDGETRQVMDIAVTWASVNPIQIRSVTFGPFTPSHDLDYVSEILDRIVTLGANFVGVEVPVHQENLYSVTFRECATVWSPEVPCLTYSDENLVSVIQMAHEKGLAVFLSPILAIASWQENTFYQQASNWNTWFENYTQVVVHYADIAEVNRVEIMAVGNEIPRSHPYKSLWDGLIDRVREHFSGDLTYRDNSQIYSPESPFPSWERLDYFGFNYWFAATGPNNGIVPMDSHPSVALMFDSFDRHLSTYFDPIVARYEKPVIITELGPDGYDGVNLDPPATNCEAEVDNQENVDYTEAFMIAALRRGWVGINAFKLQPVRNPWSPPGCNIANDMRDMPIETMFSYWFTAQE